LEETMAIVVGVRHVMSFLFRISGRSRLKTTISLTLGNRNISLQ
jgi:hypothetical protein